MKLAYLVIAHRNPKLLKKEVEALSDSDCAFFIHIDKKSNLEEFSGIRGHNVYFIDRIPVYWGEFSQVQATVGLLQQAMGARFAFDYFVLLSGSEYPLKSSREIQSFFQANQGTEFMNLVKVPNEAAGKPLARINTLAVSHESPAIVRLAIKGMARLGLAQRDYRKQLGDLEPYSGSTWWALTRDACQYALDFLEHNPHVTEFFKNTFAPDEALLHTIVGNSKFGTRTRRNLIYEDWSASAASPAMLTASHVALFESSDVIYGNDVYGSGELLFARKFSDENIELVERIDEMIARRKEPV